MFFFHTAGYGRKVNLRREIRRRELRQEAHQGRPLVNGQRWTQYVCFVLPKIKHTISHFAIKPRLLYFLLYLSLPLRLSQADIHQSPIPVTAPNSSSPPSSPAGLMGNTSSSVKSPMRNPSRSSKPSKQPVARAGKSTTMNPPPLCPRVRLR